MRDRRVIDFTCPECARRGKGTYRLASECRNCGQWEGDVVRSRGHQEGSPRPECPVCGCDKVYSVRDQVPVEGVPS